jgi:hypothetical protein
MLASAHVFAVHAPIPSSCIAGSLLLGGATAGGRERCASKPRGSLSVVLLFRVDDGISSRKLRHEYAIAN